MACTPFCLSFRLFASYLTHVTSHYVILGAFLNANRYFVLFLEQTNQSKKEVCLIREGKLLNTLTIARVSSVHNAAVISIVVTSISNII